MKGGQPGTSTNYTLIPAVLWTGRETHQPNAGMHTLLKFAWSEKPNKLKLALIWCSVQSFAKFKGN